MSELPISSPYRDRPDAPVDEAERERLSQRLKAAYAASSIDSDEFNLRLDRLWSAQRLGDLVPVVQGLPPAPTHDQPAIVSSGAGRPGELAPTRSPGSMLAVGGATVGVLALLIIVLLIVLL